MDASRFIEFLEIILLHFSCPFKFLVQFAISLLLGLYRVVATNSQ